MHPRQLLTEFRRLAGATAMAFTVGLACKVTRQQAEIVAASATSVASAQRPSRIGAGESSSSSPTNSQASGSGNLAGGDAIPSSSGYLKVTPVHHATVLLEWNGKVVYADPSNEAKYDGLPKADLIVFTHTHQDHMSTTVLAALKRPGATLVVPPEAAERLGAHAMVKLKNGEKVDIEGVTIEAVPMYNLTRGPGPGQVFHEKGRGNGYVMTFGGKRVYLSGDTECTPEMKQLENIDLAFVCMNLPYTMTPAEAAECVKAFKPRVVYPYHYRNSNLQEFETALGPHPDTEVRLRNWYP